MSPIEVKARKIDSLVRTAVICAMIGMVLVGLFLTAGFQSWSVGLGVFLGMPILVLGVALYVVAVIRDLRYRKVLDEDD